MPKKPSVAEASGEQTILDRVHRVRDEMRKKGMHTVPFDAFLWGVRDRIHRRGRERETIVRRRLEELLNFCTASSRDTTPSEAETRWLCTAVMEIPTLAPPGDPRFADVLVRLLQHRNKRVRESACQSLGRLGGAQAKAALEHLRDSGDPGLVVLARESLEFCHMMEMAYEMEPGEVEQASTYRPASGYSPAVVYVCASGGILAFGLALVAWFRYAIPLIHPVLATMGLILSAGFALASVWKQTSS